jgi:L-2-hydroxyglutarate oxidase LhgO
VTRTKYAIVGGGIIGAAAEDRLGGHQTGHNSGFVHALAPEGYRWRTSSQAIAEHLVDLILDRQGAA